MNIILEFDDFHHNKNVDCLTTIKELIKLDSNIKLTLFTPALYENIPLFENKHWCEQVKKLIESNNIQLGVHGLVHTSEEFKYKNYDESVLALKYAEYIFNKSNLDFVKIFRGPHWGINEFTYKALISLGYKAIFTHESYSHLIPKFSSIKSIIYNWNLKDDIKNVDSYLIGHGHTHNVCGNGINEVKHKIINLINNKAKFYFTDVII